VIVERVVLLILAVVDDENNDIDNDDDGRERIIKHNSGIVGRTGSMLRVLLLYALNPGDILFQQRDKDE